MISDNHNAYNNYNNYIDEYELTKVSVSVC